MRVAAFVHTFPSLSQTFILNQLDGLVASGYELDIFADHAENEIIHPAVEESGLAARTTYYQIPTPYLARVRGALGLWRKSLRNAPLAQRSLNLFRYGMEAASLRLLYQTAATARCAPYHVVHAHFGPNGLIAAKLRDLGALRGPLITSFYGYDTRQRYSRSYRFLFARGELFLVLSQTMRAQLIQLGCDREKILVHPLGVDLKRWQPAIRSERTETRIVSIARFVPKKGLEYSIRAFAELIKQNANLHYTIIGEGPLRSQIEHLIRSLNLRSRITLAGPRSQPDVVKILQESDILLAPSVTAPDGDIEGTPVAILEGMAMGLPVVSTRHSGIPEIVQDSVTGILTPEKDVSALSAALNTLVHSLALRRTMGQAGRQRVQARHNIEQLNTRLYALYQKVG